MSDAPQDPTLGAFLAKAGAGDQDAWRQLVRAYAPRLFALAHSRCRNPEIAEEITQSVLATVALKVTSGEYSELGKFESWLFRVAMNRVRDLIRQRKRRGTDEPEEPLANRPDPHRAPTLEVSDACDRLHACLRAALERLSPADREVIELRHHAQLSFKQMAETLEEPLGTLLARHHRALRKLREILEHDPTFCSLEGSMADRLSLGDSP